MRLLELQFKNLNSLQGEWRIDFTQPEYLDQGIFALVGPTGAGKSTVLDAICLALYGTTPRLGRITKGQNEIMSRQCGDCYADVLFETNQGRFRCQWQQRRARHHPEGRLQEPRHEIAQIDPQGQPQLLESMKSRVLGVIEQKTGLDFSRFTRSVLLAQGDFDAFLKANSEEKSKILEQITGSEIYSLLSQRVHQRHRHEQQRLQTLQQHTDNIALLSDEAIQQLQQQEKALDQQVIAIDRHLRQVDQAIQWWQQQHQLDQDKQQLTRQWQEWQQQNQAFAFQRQRWQQAQRADRLNESYQRTHQLAQQQKEQQDELSIIQQSLQTIGHDLDQAEKIVQAKKSHWQQCCQDFEKKRCQLASLRQLDQQIADLDQAMASHQQSCHDQQQTFLAAKNTLDTLCQQQQQLTEQQAQHQHYMTQHQPDHWLVNGLVVVEQKLNDFTQQQQALQQVNAEQQQAEKKHQQQQQTIADAEQKCHHQKAALDQAQRDQTQTETTLEQLLDGQLLREYRSRYEHLQQRQADQRLIASLQEQRQQLISGQPCPLCGSLDHPYHQQPPVQDDWQQAIQQVKQRIAAIEEQQQRVDQAKSHCRDCQHQWQLSVNQHQQALARGKDLANDAQEQQDHYHQQQQALAHREQQLLTQLKPLGIQADQLAQPNALLDNLQQRLDQWQQVSQAQADVDRKQQELDTTLASQQAHVHHHQQQYQQLQQSLTTLQTQQQALHQQRQQDYGSQSAEAIQAKYQQTLDQAHNAMAAQEKHWLQLQQQQTSLAAQHQALHAKWQKSHGEHQQQQQHFLQECQQQGFADLTQWQNARMSFEQQQSLQAQDHALHTQQVQLETRQTDLDQLETGFQSTKPSQSLCQLQPQKQQAQEQRQKHLQKISDCRWQRQQDQQARQQHHQRHQQILAQQSLCHDWQRLNDLIGSSDGKKYRTFAQGLTFECLLSQANQQLERMSQRYWLLHDPDQPLDLQVIDRYQAGEIRSIRNLSGGESFLVSLALALGLASMTSCSVQVDSLFLDEGFGTLDEESLETALDALSKLQQDGKLIGVISHVPAMQHSIASRITITPDSAGRSVLSGPGCQRLA